MPAADFTQEHYLVIGLGLTGLAVARYLSSQGKSFSLADTRLHPPGLEEAKQEWPEVSIWLGPLDASLTCAASCLVVSPGISVQSSAIQTAKDEGVEVIGDIELFCRHLSAQQQPLIAITGSNAKSTVTSLVAAMAEAAGLKVGMAGNIGIPVLDLLVLPQPDIYILELSSFQLETTFSMHATAACLLNISDDHLDRYASIEDYVFAKQRIYHLCKNAIYNREDAQTLPIHGLTAPKLNFGLSAPTNESELGLAELATGQWLMRGREPLMPAAEVPLVGQHGLANTLAAFALGLAVGLPVAAMRKATQSFSALPHRCQLVAVKQGVSFYNDSKATNLGATLAALAGLAQEKPVWLILGGQAKGQDFTPLTQALHLNVAGVALIGIDADILADFIPATLVRQKCASLPEAVSWLAQQAQSGEQVLLSPACASLDMFTSFEQRGEVFTQCVLSLPN